MLVRTCHLDRMLSSHFVYVDAKEKEHDNKLSIYMDTGRCRCSLECLWHSKEQMRHIKSRRGANAKRIQDLSGEFKMERLIIKME